MGNQTLLTPEIQAIFVKYIKKGVPAEHVCPLANITGTTYYNWLKKGREGAGENYVEFFEAVGGAKSEYLASLAEKLSDHIEKTHANKKLDPYLILKALNLRDRDNWGEKHTMVHQGDEENPILIMNLTNEDRDKTELPPTSGPEETT